MIMIKYSIIHSTEKQLRLLMSALTCVSVVEERKRVHEAECVCEWMMLPWHGVNPYNESMPKSGSNGQSGSELAVLI